MVMKIMLNFSSKVILIKLHFIKFIIIVAEIMEVRYFTMVMALVILKAVVLVIKVINADHPI